MWFHIKSLLKFFIIIIISLSIPHISPATAHAYTVPSKIRVGLESKYKNVTSVPVENISIITGFEINGNFTPCAEFSSGTFGVVTTDLYYVRSPQYFYSYELAKSYAASFISHGLASVVAVKGPNEFYVFFGGYNSQQEAERAVEFTQGTVVVPNSRRTMLTASGQIILVFDNDTSFPQISAAVNGELVDLGERQYRGVVEFNRASGMITAINICTLDEYLYSSVASEMFSSWHNEALKAQAVALRSYILTLSAHKDTDYNICDKPHCQSYSGASAEIQQVNNAVALTSGIIALYEDKPINAVFFSSSGGYTDNSENVWNEAVPYLRAVNDSIEAEPKLWSRSFSLLELTNMLLAKNVNIGNVVGVSIKKEGASGRVIELTFQGTAGSKAYTKEEIRNIFSATSGGSLESRNFTIENGVTTSLSTNTAQLMDSAFRIQGGTAAVDSSLANTYIYSRDTTIQPASNFINNGSTASIATRSGVTSVSTAQFQSTSIMVAGGQNGSVSLTGKGFGHGVGMSQFGAKSMAEAGYDFKSIIRKYYSGVYFSNE